MKFAVPSPDKGKTERGRLQNSRFFFWKSVKKSVKRGLRVLRARSALASLFSASFQTFCLTARAYLNTQKYGLFRSLGERELRFFFAGGEGSTSRRHCAQPKTLSNGVANYIIKDKVRNIFNSTYTSVKVTCRSASLMGMKVWLDSTFSTLLGKSRPSALARRGVSKWLPISILQERAGKRSLISLQSME